jgi:hypothetical protein
MPFPTLPAKTMKNQKDANPDGTNPPITIIGYWQQRKYAKAPIKYPDKKLVIPTNSPITPHQIRTKSISTPIGTSPILLIESTCIKMKMHGM